MQLQIEINFVQNVFIIAFLFMSCEIVINEW